MTGTKQYQKGGVGPRRFGEHKVHNKLKLNASTDLRAGDILIAKEWTPHNKESFVIPTAQMLLSHHGGASGASEHVLLVLEDGKPQVAEAVGGGVSIDVGVNMRDHVVYSCLDETLRWEAVFVAERLGGAAIGGLNTETYDAGKSPVQYRKSVGMTSVLFRRKNKGSKARARIKRLYDYVYDNKPLGGARMVCSEFAVSCYEVAAEKLGMSVFNVDPQAISAKALEALLMNRTGSFRLAGRYIGSRPYRKGQQLAISGPS